MEVISGDDDGSLDNGDMDRGDDGIAYFALIIIVNLCYADLAGAIGPAGQAQQPNRRFQTKSVVPGSYITHIEIALNFARNEMNIRKVGLLA